MSAKPSSKGAARAPMTKAAASRIQNSTAKANGGQVSKGSFASRATSAAARKGN